MSATPTRSDYSAHRDASWRSAGSSSGSSSSSSSSSSSTTTSRTSLPLLPLHVTVHSPERTKALRFQASEAQDLTFDTFYARIERCLQYEEHSFEICWKDDDGEVCEISSTPELHEAMAYFGPSDPSSSVEQVSMRVTVRVESTVPLSDFGETETDAWSGSEEGYPAAGRRGSLQSSTASAPRAPSYDGGDSVYSALSNDVDPWASHFSSSSSSSASSAGSSRRRATRPRRSRHANTDARRGRDRSVGSNGSSLDGDGESGSDTENEDGPVSAVAELHPNDIDIPIDGRGMSGSVHRQARGARPSRPKAVHDGIACAGCGTKPIVGNRFHCASCHGGADFCSSCEDTGEALDHPGHLPEHIVLKIAVPLDSQAAARTLTTKLAVAQHRLLSQSAASPGMDWPVAHGSHHGSHHGGSHSGPNWNRPGGFIHGHHGHGHVHGHWGHRHEVTISTSASPTPSPSPAAVPCSFCSEPLTTGPRYLCANCPLGTPDSPEGYNLCSSCEPHSLQIHDPRHFFLKIRLSALAARGEAPSSFRRNPAIAGRSGLLPPLYREPETRRGSPRGALGISDHRSYVRNVELGMTEAGAASSSSPSPSIGTELKQAAMADAENMFRYLGLSLASIKNRCKPGLQQAVAGPSSQADRAAAAELGAEGEANEVLEMRALEHRRANLVPLESLIHPNIVCDSCFEVIEGAWFKCCNCATCYDLCSRCEARMGHDPRHVFAVLKQPVDIDCFKSLADIFGPDSMQNKPLLPFLLV